MATQTLMRKVLVGAAFGAGLTIGHRLLAASQNNSAMQQATYPPLDVPKRVADATWIVDSGPMSAMGMMLPVRMAIVRLSNGDLLLHSPTRFNADLAHHTEALGRVRHLVAPNSAHWTFLADWQRAYPEAISWAAPGLRDRPQVRRSGIRLDRDLSNQAPAEWASEIEQGIVPGGAGFREVYFFHKPTGTLLLTDLVENLDPAKLPFFTRVAMQAARATNGRTAVHLRAIFRFGGAEAENAIRHLVGLKPERVIFAHGRWFEDRGAERLKRAFDWLL